MSVFIIAEAGVNHNGDIATAKRLIEEAADAGCDAIKFQTYKTEKLVTHSARQADYQQENLKRAESQFSMLKRYELSEQEFAELFSYAESKGIEFMSTPFDECSVQELERIGVKRYKLSSGDLTNRPLIRRVAQTGKPIILSTGMATLAEVGKAIGWCDEAGAAEVCLLHCTSSYPTEFNNVNMLAMDTLREAFGRPVGYSDHTIGIEVPIMAVARGACVIEKHITLSQEMDGPDHRASLAVKDLSQLVKCIRHVEDSFGSPIKQPSESELETARLVRKSLVSTVPLSIGEQITSDKIAVKRPATGIPPEYMDDVVGKRLVRSVPADTPICWSDIDYE